MDTIGGSQTNMSDINVTVSTFPINVSVNAVGVQGPSGANGGGSSSSNDFVVFTTGNQTISGIKTFNDSLIINHISGSNGNFSLDLNNGYITSVGNIAVDANTKQLYNNNGTSTLKWHSQTLNDLDSFVSVNWNNRELRDALSSVSVNWSGRFLSGAWTKNGDYILTSVDSGNLRNVINNTGAALITLINSSTPQNVVFTTGNQTISGEKFFVDKLTIDNHFIHGNNHNVIGSLNFSQGLDHTIEGSYSHAEGFGNTIYSFYSHVEGTNNTVSGDYSHAEGTNNTTIGSYSHAEGVGNTAIGNYSHAEGVSTIAHSNFSHSDGLGTIASGVAQLAIGQYNIPDNNSLFIVGNGVADDNRSNILLVNVSGAYISGSKVLTILDSGNLQNQINNLPQISNAVTGSGINNYIAKFGPDGSGLVNSNIIDSGNQIQFRITNNGLYSGIYFINNSGIILTNNRNLYLTKNNHNIGLTTSDGFTLNFTQDGATKAALNNNGDLNVSNLSMNGDTYLRRYSAANFGISSNSSSVFGGLKVGFLYATGGIYLTGNVAINNSSPVSAFDITGNITASGINLTSRAWSNLTWNTGTVWEANQFAINQKAVLVLTGNTTLQINNLYNGWEGTLKTLQSGANPSGYSLTVSPTPKVQNNGSGIIYLSSGVGLIDVLGFCYDGTDLLCNYGNTFT